MGLARQLGPCPDGQKESAGQMVSVNKMIVIGNLGTEPEMRFTPNGRPVTSFAVATN